MNPASARPDESPFRSFDLNSRAYIGAWLMLICALAVLSAFSIIGRHDQTTSGLYVLALGLLVASTVALFALLYGVSMSIDDAMMLALIPDLAGIAIFVYLGGSADPFYPVIVMTPIFYSLVVRRREAWLVGAGAMAAYVIGLLFIGPQSTSATVLFVFKAGIVPVAGFLVADSVERQRSRETFVERAAAETARLNAQLRRRVHELQAISQVSEVIHSSLRFPGPQVLEIVAEAIGIDMCCLFVVDKSESETLFSATRGTTGTVADPVGPAPYVQDVEHLSCVPVFDHGSTIVLFCAEPEALAGLTDDEHLVLGAVASELVVAVENSRLYELTSHLATTDELTGLANYRQLQLRLDEELARARRYNKNLSLLMLDADQFKEFNDAQGHVAGDVALSEIGSIIKGLVREVDVAARYGGEEFSVVLPETDLAGAYVAAEKIREAIELHDFCDAVGERVCKLTVSIGLASYPSHGEDKDSVLRQADGALYHAKRGGKNRVRAPMQRHRASAHEQTVSADGPSATNDEWTGV